MKNVFAIEYFKLGIVPGNNLNVNYIEQKNEELATDIELYNTLRAEASEDDENQEWDDIDLPGALVGDPTKNEPEGVVLFGKKSAHYYKDTIDFDYSSEYPNAKITANIAPHTQIGRLIIPKQILPNENPDNNPKFIRAGKFIEDIETGDSAKIGAWFNLPTSYDIIKKYEKIRNEKSNDGIETVDGYVRMHRIKEENK